MASGNQDVILFYKAENAYGCFSNFSSHPVHLKGKRWPTSEHYFQAMKFEGTPHEKEIWKAATPGAAAKKGRDRSRPLRKDWEKVTYKHFFRAFNVSQFA